MRYQLSLASLAVLLWGPYAESSVSEVEPNSPVTGSALYYENALYGYTRETDSAGFNDTARQDPGLATALSLTDEMVGQLGSTRDYDWYYVDIADSNQAVTPVYFGCDKKLGYYFEGPDGTAIDETKDVLWQIEYYYDSDPATPGGLSKQSSYVVYPNTCKRGAAETKGPMRFQMNTQRPGRYYVRVWGKYVGSKLVEDEIVTGTDPDGKPITAKRKTYYDVVVVPTADYTLRLYTARIGGELEPNDGMVEAYALTSGAIVPAQLSSMYDQDWFYIDNDISRNTTKKLPFYFNCKGQTGSTYILSAYNQLGVLQSNYEVKAEQCNGSSGFSFTIDAPVSARYYFEVSSPTYTDTDQFTQSDYSIRVIAGTDSNAQPEVPTRLPGELEPNETPINAYPLTSTELVTAQLAAITDQDYYVYEKAAGDNSAAIPIYFGCNLPADNTTANFTIAYFNNLGILQKSYTIGAADCSIQPKTMDNGTTIAPATGGFKFTMQTPAAGKYYILVSGPADADATKFSDADYTLSTFLDIAGQIPPTNTGNLKAANIVDNSATNRDNFTINLNQCGAKGALKLSGSKLNLTGLDTSSQVLVQIGQWSCLSDAKELYIGNTDSAKTTYVYPKPVTPPQTAKKTKITRTQ